MNWIALATSIVGLAGSAAAATLSPDAAPKGPLAGMLDTDGSCTEVAGDCHMHDFAPDCLAACAHGLAGDMTWLASAVPRSPPAVSGEGPPLLPIPVPIPATLPLLASALAGLAMLGRRRRRRVRVY